MLKKLKLLSSILIMGAGLFLSAPAMAFTAPKISNANYGGKFIAQLLPDPIVLTVGETKELAVRIKNTGKITWTKNTANYVSAYTVNPNHRSSLFATSSWLAPDQPAKIQNMAKPGQVAEARFKLTAPDKPGDYEEHFYLAAEKVTYIKGTHFYFKIKVVLPPQIPFYKDESSNLTTSTTSTPASAEATAGKPEAELEDVATSTDQFVVSSTRELALEPRIRVGLYKATGPVQVKSNFPYEVYAGGVFKGVLPAGELAVFSYKKGVSYFKGGDLDFNLSRDAIRLEPANFNNYFTLINYQRKLSYRGSQNFNAYRGAMEFKYSPKSGAPFVVNELPLDLYLQGIAETSNEAAPEYIKALLIAARSYAYYHLKNGVPAEARVYDVVANTGDQLYLGYNSEVALPRVAKAAQDTYGLMVTYNSKPVVTPYFGHSDGNTRAWKQVWGGADKPWLKSVSCFYDTGEKMWGHGVGLSAQDASARASQDGWTYDQLLKYYYNGTEVEKVY